MKLFLEVPSVIGAEQFALHSSLLWTAATSANSKKNKNKKLVNQAAVGVKTGQRFQSVTHVIQKDNYFKQNKTKSDF